MTQPLVSVVVPTYNRAYTLSKALDSVLKQNHSSWELLVVDDGSEDSTQELLKAYLEQNSSSFSIRALYQENQGVSAARNLALRQSRGEWVAFLDSDDEWLPEKLSQQLALAEAQPKLNVIHSEEIWVRGGRRVNPRQKHLKQGGWIFEQSLKLCSISPSSVLIRKDFLLEYGGFREDFPVCEDYHLWLHMTSEHPVGLCPEPLVVKYGGHEDQLSTKYKAMDYYRVLAMDEVLRQRNLSLLWKRMTRQELLFKTNLLLIGYEKHNNYENYQRVQDLQNHWSEQHI